MFQIQNKNEIINSYTAGVRDFSNSILTAINFTESNLKQINLDESNLIEVNWSNCNLNQASFRYTYLGLSNFHNCCLVQANLEGANLEQANLQGANLEQANLQGANLEQANLQGANLKGADLRNIKLDRACFAGAVYSHETLFDRNFDPQTSLMVAENTHISDDLDNSNLSEPKRGAVKKILSWCRSPKLNLQTQER